VGFFLEVTDEEGFCRGEDLPTGKEVSLVLCGEVGVQVGIVDILVLVLPFFGFELNLWYRFEGSKNTWKRACYGNQIRDVSTTWR
jgi:hypothetical protein